MISRRHFLAGTGAALVLAACGDDGDDTAASTTRPDSTTAGPTDSSTGTDGGDTTTSVQLPSPTDIVLGEAFDRNFLLVKGIPQRAPFVLFQRSGGLMEYADAPDVLEFVPQHEQDDPLPAISVTKRGEDVGRPYYPLVTTFEESGTWKLLTEVNGVQMDSAIHVNDTIGIPQIGQAMPSASTPTTATPLAVQTLCTRDPACPFHDVSLDAALAAGRPVTVLLSTPAYCQVGICGPVLDLLIAEAPSHPDMAVIHIEVYPNGAPSATIPPTPLVTDTFKLAYEPALFVAGADGLITARLDNIYDGAELAEVMAAV